jgi:hypothetical protein
MLSRPDRLLNLMSGGGVSFEVDKIYNEFQNLEGIYKNSLSELVHHLICYCA